MLPLQLMLIQKFKPKSGEIALIHSPKDILAEFKPFKPKTSISSRAKERFDFVLLFATNSGELNSAWKQIIPALKTDAAFWVSYPKKSSGIQSDLAGMSGGWAAYAGSPWQPVASVSVNETWTAIRFKYSPNLEEKRKERVSEEIHDADGTLVVDRVNRVVYPPKDFAQVLSKHPEARIFFDGLSFTNKKEYVTWIVEAKQKETRDKRLMSALEKLASAKKNPSDK